MIQLQGVGVMVSPDHVIALPGGSWRLWRDVALRGAGFPADRVLELASSGVVAATERCLRGEREEVAARRRALAETDRALDTLRKAGAWDDKSRRKPLLKALNALAAGKNVKPSGVVAVDEAVAAVERAKEVVQKAQEALVAAWEEEQSRTSGILQTVAADPRFREAVLWQNRHAVVTALDGLRAAEGTGGSQQRQHEHLVANYLQRYCVKNDTIGFFGPVGWATLEDEEGRTVIVEPGETLLEQRQVYFESWCIDALARKLAADTALRPWLAPRRKVHFSLEGTVLHRPFGSPLELSPEEARLLALCDGRRAAWEIAQELVAHPDDPAGSPEAIYQRLEDLLKRRVLNWTLEVPLELHPERSLRRLLERIEPDELRRPALAALGALVEARRSVEAAAGDGDALALALAELEATFIRLTGQDPRRNLGQTYGARGLVYEDCRRGGTVRFGQELVEALGPPLTLKLRAAHWLAAELGRRVEARLGEIYDRLREKRGTEAVDSYSFFSQGLSSLFLKRQRDECFEALEAEYQRRWMRILDLEPDFEEGPVEERTPLQFNAEELRTRFDREFGDPGPVWSLATYFSPDLMIVTESPEAFARGEFQVVLGETHASNTMSWSCFVSQHPDPQRTLDGMVWDRGERQVVIPQMIKQNWTQRMSTSLILPDFYRYAFADEPLPPGQGVVLGAGEVVVVREAGRLLARSRDGSHRFPALELFGFHMVNEMNGLIGAFLPPRDHWPRVAVDRVVVARERWRFAAADLSFASLKNPEERFLAARRWAEEHGLPRFCFFKVSWERKPCYLDLNSPVYVELFAKMVRSADERAPGTPRVSLSEMLPRIDQAWLRDARGQKYTSELRLAALDAAWRKTP